MVYKKKSSGSNTDILDLSKQEVVEHVENSICKIIDEYKVDLFRLDYNISYKHMHFENERGENGIYRYYENLYALFDRMRKKYPSVIFENCASGGARTDLGLVKYFNHTWVTDNQRLPDAIGITNGMTIVLPAERVDRLASGMESHRIGSLRTLVRHTIFGRPTINSFNCMDSVMNTEQISIARHTYDIYKNIVRPFAPTGRFYHHTPEVNGRKSDGIIVMERTASDKSVGILGVFRLCEVNQNEINVKCMGVDKSKNYAVTFDNDGESVVLSGYQLSQGIQLSLPSALTSELLIYKKI